MIQAYRNSHGNTNKEQICPKADRNKSLVSAELVIESVGDCTSQAEWQNHTRRPHTESYSPIFHQKTQVHLESDEEEEEDQTNIGGG